MSATTTRSPGARGHKRLHYDPKLRRWVEVWVPKPFVRRDWVEPNFRGAARRAPGESLADLFLSAGGVASFVLAFVLVLVAALFLQG